jgi:hypothetical protein
VPAGVVDDSLREAALVVDPDMAYIELDLDPLEDAGWVAHGFRRLEDYLLVYAAFAREWPEKETP